MSDPPNWSPIGSEHLRKGGSPSRIRMVTLLRKNADLWPLVAYLLLLLIVVAVFAWYS